MMADGSFAQDAESVVKSTIEDKAHRERDHLAGSRDAAEVALEAARAAKPRPDETSAGLVESAASKIKQRADKTVSDIVRAGEMAFNLSQEVRLFQFDLQLERPPVQINILSIVFMFVCFMCVEGGGSGILFVADGRMGWGEGLGYGFTFAAALAAIGLFLGWGPLRYSIYRRTALEPKPHDRTIRLMASGLAILIGLLLFLLIFGAMRTRATGSHHGVFNFDQVGLWEGFNDSIAILIAAITIIGALFAIYKGFTAFDPVIGYGELGKRARLVPLKAAETAMDRGTDAVETLADDALETLDARAKASRDQAKQYNTSIRAAVQGVKDHNRRVDLTAASIRRFAELKERRFRFIREAVPIDEPLSIDLSNITCTFQAYQIRDCLEVTSLLGNEQGFDLAELKLELTAAQDMALARIEAAMAKFEAVLDGLQAEAFDDAL